MKYYKILEDDRKSHYSNYQWPEVGEWTDTVKNVRVCGRGFHVCTERQLRHWTHCGQHLYEVELDGYQENGRLQTAGQRARLTRYLGYIPAEMSPYMFT